MAEDPEDLLDNEIVALWNAMPTREFDRVFMPLLLDNRDLLEPDDPIHELLDRWDTETECLRPCPICMCADHDHAESCAHFRMRT